MYLTKTTKELFSGYLIESLTRFKAFVEAAKLDPCFSMSRALSVAFEMLDIFQSIPSSGRDIMLALELVAARFDSSRDGVGTIIAISRSVDPNYSPVKSYTLAGHLFQIVEHKDAVLPREVIWSTQAVLAFMTAQNIAEAAAITGIQHAMPSDPQM